MLVCRISIGFGFYEVFSFFTVVCFTALLLWVKLVSNSWPACLGLPSAEQTGVYNTWPEVYTCTCGLHACHRCTRSANVEHPARAKEVRFCLSKVEGESWLMGVALWAPQEHCGTCMPTLTHTPHHTLTIITPKNVSGAGEMNQWVCASTNPWVWIPNLHVRSRACLQGCMESLLCRGWRQEDCWGLLAPSLTPGLVRDSVSRD